MILLWLKIQYIRLVAWINSKRKPVVLPVDCFNCGGSGTYDDTLAGGWNESGWGIELECPYCFGYGHTNEFLRPWDKYITMFSKQLQGYIWADIPPTNTKERQVYYDRRDKLMQKLPHTSLNSFGTLFYRNSKGNYSLLP
jgi:hypothetical protein